MEDSYTIALQDYLLENEPPEIEAYEMAKEMADHPTLAWLNKSHFEQFELRPGAEETVEVLCSGKLGLLVALLTKVCLC